LKNIIKNLWTTLTKNPTVGGRLLLILLVIAILVIAILLSGPKPKDYPPIPTPTPIPIGLTSPAVTPTRLPSSEYVQATGVIVAVTTIVFVIIIGTMIEMVSKKNKNRT
jgi:hypothetical protein